MTPAKGWSAKTWEAIEPFIRLGSTAKLERAFDKPYELHYGVMANTVLLDLSDPEVADDVRKMKIRRYGISLLEMMTSIGVEAESRGLRLSDDFYKRLEVLGVLVKKVYTR